MQIKRKMFQIGGMTSLASLLLLAACQGGSSGEADVETGGSGSEEETGGEVRIAYSAQPPVLDPHTGNVASTADIIRNVYEPLLTMDSDYNIEPMLAESYEISEEGTEIDFQLREGVLFHNGEEMTADDVAASMDKWLDSPGSRDQFHEDAYAEAVDDYHVRIHLQEQLAPALPLMAYNSAGFPGIMPQEIAEEADASGVTEHIGTGPFVFEEWRTDQHIHLSKFDDYQSREEEADGLAGKREPLVDDIYFEIVTDSSTRMSGAQSGEYDIIHAVPYDNAEQLEETPHLENHVDPSSNLQIIFNKQTGFFEDQEARMALATSIDHEPIMLGAYTNEEYFDLNNNILMYHQEAQWDSEVGADIYNRNDPSTMEDYLNDIDYNGEQITIITNRDYEDHYNGAVVLQQQMEQMGMKVDLEVYDWSTKLDMIEDENAYDLYVMGISAKPEPTSNNFFDPSWPGWTEAPEILEEFRSQPTIEDSAELYDELMEWYYDYIPAIVVGDMNRVTTTQDSIHNMQYQDGMILWNMTTEDN